MTNAYAGPECDRGGCPAAGVRTLVLHGQDFYLCEHHGREVDVVLGTDPEPFAPAADDGPTAEREPELAFATSW